MGCRRNLLDKKTLTGAAIDARTFLLRRSHDVSLLPATVVRLPGTLDLDSTGGYSY